MVSLRNCKVPSGGTLALAVILTYLTLSLFHDQKTESSTPENPIAGLSFNTTVISKEVIEPVRDLSSKATRAFQRALHRLQNASALVGTFAHHWARKFDSPWSSLFSRPSERVFLPSAYYETERHGAIDIFEKHGMTVCRIYKVCRLQDGQLQVPEWAKQHSKVLGNKCGLSRLQFEPTWTLKSRFGLRPYYDWIGPDVPTHELLKFTRVPLSYFFAPRNGTKSYLDTTTPKNKVTRTCLSPNGNNSSKITNRICNTRPEGRISNPAFLVNTHERDVHADYKAQTALTAEFLRIHGVEADVFDDSSALLKRRKACFRSIIVAPGFAHVEHGNEVAKSGHAVNASQVADMIHAADKIIHKELHKATNTSSNSYETENKEDATASPEPKHQHNVETTGNLHGNKQANSTSTRKAKSNRPHSEGSKVNQNGTLKLERIHNETLKDTGTNDSPSPSATPSSSPSPSAAQSIPLKRNPLSQLTRQSAQPSKHDELFHTQGGAELFTHRAVEGRDWNSTSQTYGVCRIHRACRKSDQTLVLPQWMQSIESELRLHCGLSSVTYVNETTFFKLYTRSKQTELDLMGVRIYRAQEQHFMTDFFHDGLHAFDALYNQHRGRHAIFKRRCIYNPALNLSETIRKSQGCIGTRTESTLLHPAILLDERARGGSMSAKYIGEMLAMMPQSKVIYPNKLDMDDTFNSTCFRSIILTRNSYPPRHVLQHQEGNIFFKLNNLSRQSILHTVPTTPCSVQLTILHPFKQQHLITWKRKMAVRTPQWKISNLDNILQSLHQKAGLQNLSLQTSIFTHGSNIRQAQNTIQQSEIIVGVNNPAMTSITFARPHTRVIEIQPFAYSTGPYRSFSRSLHLVHQTLTSLPDYSRFSHCIQENYREDWKESLSQDEMKQRMYALLTLFKHAMNGTNLQLSSKLHNNEPRWQHIPLERVCARAQRIRIDSDVLVNTILSHAHTICKNRAHKPLPDSRTI